MKILLINPPRTYFPGSKGVRLGLPLGLLYLAAVLEKDGYQPKILDCLIQPKTRVISKDGGIFHGISDDDILDFIKKEKPDIVGIGGPFTVQIDNTIKIANLIKRADSNIIVVAGGPHVAVRGRQLLEQCADIDIGVAGEGEFVFLDIVKKIESGQDLASVKNLIYRNQQNEIITTERGDFIRNLDCLPFPAYHLIDLPLYFDFLAGGLSARPSGQKKSISMITSRGCPFNCIFCSIHLHMGRLWRAHSDGYVISHIEYVVEKYGVEHISFEDDNLTADMARAKKIFNRLIDKKINITWDTPNGVRADRLDENLAAVMKKSGCVELIFGVESGDQDVLTNIVSKNLDLNSVIESARICQKFKIKTKAFFVIGFPGEKIKDIRQSMDFAVMLRQKYGVVPGFMVATPLIGTKLYDICKEHGYLVREPDSASLAKATQARGEGLIETGDFSPRQLKDLAFEFEKKLAKMDLIDKIKNPTAYFRALRFVVLHPRKAIKHLKSKIFG